MLLETDDTRNPAGRPLGHKAPQLVASRGNSAACLAKGGAAQVLSQPILAPVEADGGIQRCTATHTPIAPREQRPARRQLKEVGRDCKTLQH